MTKDTSIYDFDEKKDLSIFDWKDESHKRKRRKSVIRPRKTAKKKSPPKKRRSPKKKRSPPKKRKSPPKKTARQSLAEAVRRTPRRKKKRRKTVARKRLSTIQEGSHEESSIASIFQRK